MTYAAYKNLALGLWGLVAVVAGYTGGVVLGMAGREMLFPIVLALGLFALVAYWFLRGGRSVTASVETKAAAVKLLADGEEESGLEALINRGEDLKPQEASRWLDGLLERHQK